MLANPVKGEVPVVSAAGTLTFVLDFAAQKAVEQKFGRRFPDLVADFDELMLSDVGFVWWAGFQRHHPDLSEAQTDGLIDEVGVPAMFATIGEALRLAYGSGEADASANPPKARSKPEQ